MTVFLFFLLAWATLGLTFLGFHAFQLRTRAARLNGELVAQIARYDKDIKEWNDYAATVKVQYQGLVDKCNEDSKKCSEYSANLKAENQRLSKWKSVADADARASEMLQTARATFEKANADAADLLATAQQRAATLQAEASQNATSELADAKETA